jgi:uncharacterized protein (TIGR03435 family)
MGFVGFVGFVRFVGFGVLLSAALSAQAPNIDALQFEVASVKPNTSGSQNSNMQLHPGGRVTGTNVALGGLLRTVFNLQPHQLINAPEWIDTARFDIEAKPDREISTREDTLAPELLAMLRNLFAERFQLIAHREMRDTSVYALVTARTDGSLGPHMRRSQVDCEAVRCRISTNAGRIVGTGTTIAELMRRLSPTLGRPLVDRTGLSGPFDLELKWSPDQTADTAGPSIFTAIQEQLGLKLESQRAPIEVLVIDRLERPTPD